MTMERFHYTVPADAIDGAKTDKKIVLPRFQNLPFGVMRKVNKTDQSAQIFVIFDYLIDEEKVTKETAEVLDSLSIEAVSDLMDAWSKDAETSLPESSAS